MAALSGLGAPAKVAVCVVRLFSAAYGGKSRGGQSRLNGKGLSLTWWERCPERTAAQPLSPHYRSEHRTLEAAMFRNSYQARVSPRVRCWVWLSLDSSEVGHTPVTRS